MIIELTIALLGGGYAEGPWQGVLEIDDQSSLDALHLAIQDAVHFDNDHLYEFFIARTPNSRDRLVMDFESDAIHEVALEDVFPLENGRKLFYMFDYGDSWLFSVSKGRKKAWEPVSGIRYPRLTSETGTTPEQYPDFEEDAE
jgi:hypothetical protein